MWKSCLIFHPGLLALKIPIKLPWWGSPKEGQLFSQRLYSFQNSTPSLPIPYIWITQTHCLELVDAPVSPIFLWIIDPNKTCLLFVYSFNASYLRLHESEGLSFLTVTSAQKECLRLRQYPIKWVTYWYFQELTFVIQKLFQLFQVYPPPLIDSVFHQHRVLRKVQWLCMWIKRKR